MRTLHVSLIEIVNGEVGDDQGREKKKKALKRSVRLVQALQRSI
jgi:hypothetical protein